MCHQAPRIFRDSLMTIPQGHTLVRETLAPCDPGSLKYRGLCTDPDTTELVDS